jgi:peptidyl-prolyl cis-trans isomerase-like 4
MSCEIIRDWKTGDSLQYAFIEFETEAACIEAYSRMENVLIDERRIHVDFSQSVAKLWNKHRRGVLREAAQQIVDKERETREQHALNPLLPKEEAKRKK